MKDRKFLIIVRSQCLRLVASRGRYMILHLF